MADRRGMHRHPHRVVSIIGLAVIVVLLTGTGAAVASPPDHAQGDPAPHAKDDEGSSASAAGHDEPRGRATGGRRGGPGRSSDQGQSQGTAQRRSQDPGQAADKPGGRAPEGRAHGRDRPTSGPSHGAPPHQPGEGTPDPDGGPPADRDSQPPDPSEPPQDAEPGEPDEDAEPSDPADGDDAPFARGSPGADPGTGSVQIAAPAADAQQPDEPVGLAGVTAPEPRQGRTGGTADTHLFERLSQGTNRALDRVLSPGRDFGVPALLLATLGAYLLLQRRLDRGALPMSSLASSPDGTHTDVRYDL